MLKIRTAVLVAAGAVLSLAPAGTARPDRAPPSQTDWQIVSATGTTSLILNGRFGPDFTGGTTTVKADASATWRLASMDAVSFPFASIPTYRPNAVARSSAFGDIKGRLSGSAKVTFGDGKQASCTFAFSSLRRPFFSRSAAPELFLNVWRQGSYALFAVDGQNMFHGFVDAPQCELASSGTVRGPDNTGQATIKRTALVAIRQRTPGKRVVLVINRVYPVTAGLNGRVVRIGTITEKAKITLKLTSAL